MLAAGMCTIRVLVAPLEHTMLGSTCLEVLARHDGRGGQWRVESVQLPIPRISLRVDRAIRGQHEGTHVGSPSANCPSTR
jgi:hypothetical protein